MTQAIEVRAAAIGYWWICNLKNGERHTSSQRLGSREAAFAAATAFYNANSNGVPLVVTEPKSVSTHSATVTKKAVGNPTKVTSKGKRIDPVTGRSINADGSIRAVRGSKKKK